MITNFTQSLLICLVLFPFYTTQAQDFNSVMTSGEYVFNENRIPCLTEEQRTAIKIETNNNITALKLQNKLARSEEHTSELQSRENLVCRLLLEKKKKNYKQQSR